MNNCTEHQLALRLNHKVIRRALHRGVVRRLLLSLTILFFLTGLPMPYSQASENTSDTATFSELVVTTSETHLIFFGVIANAFSEEMVAGLKSGVPIDFSFFLELQRIDRDKGKQILVRRKFRHTLTYDTLKDNYKVELEERNDRVLSFSDLTKAKAAMSEINGAQVIALTHLVLNSTYKLRVRADLFKQTLPLSLHHILPFVSWWDRETGWQIIEFNY